MYDGQSYSTYYGLLYGGYNAPHTKGVSNSSSYRGDRSYVYYNEQPFLIGHVLWITSIQPNITPPRISGYLTIVAFNKQGKIIRPLCPY